MLTNKSEPSIKMKINKIRVFNQEIKFELDFKNTNEFKEKEISINNEKFEIITIN